CYRVLLRAYPPHYRTRFGGDMLDTFVRDYARVCQLGGWSVIRFWIVTFAQAVWFGASERRGPAQHPGAPMPSNRFRFSLVPDIRYALRLLSRSPLFAVTSVVSLALGLAATTVIFNLTDAILLRQSPGVREPERLLDIARSTNGSGYDNMSYPTFQYLREHSQSFESMAATTFEASPLSLSEGGSSERVFGQLVSASYFDVLKVHPAAGRFFRSDEDQAGDERPVVVLTHHLWRDRFAADPAIVGRTLRINNRDCVVVGVAEEGFNGATMLGTDVWMPMAMVGTVRGGRGVMLLNNVRAVWHMAIGRLKPGVTPGQAQTELETLLTAFKTANPDVPARYGMAVAPVGRLPVPFRTPIKVFFGVLFALTGGLLAIACSNVAGMLLARATARRREIATRLAIGASRGQLIAQLLTETLVLFVVAALTAVPVAVWLSGVLQSFLPSLPLPVSIEWVVGARAMLFALGLSLIAGLVFGLAPARHALRTNLSSALHGHASTATRERLRLRHALVVAQVALSLTMVITAGLFVRTLVAAANISPGFRIANVELVTVDTTLAGAEGAKAVALIDRVVESVRAIPGVDRVGHSRMVPLQGGGMGLGNVRVPGLGEDAANRLNNSDWDVVSPDYFRTLEIPVMDGRVFTPEDRAGRPLVVVVNETFARIAWPGRSAVGQRFWQTDGGNDPGRPLEVVGVVHDAKYRSISEVQAPFIYVPFAQQTQTEVALYVAHDKPVDLGPAVRQAIARVDPGLPVILAQSLEDATMIGLLPQRIAAWVAGSVGTIGIFLAALGLYGLTAFLVAQRTREIAIRMAMGATQGQVQTMVLRQAARLGVIGGVIGLALAAGLGRVVQSLSLLVNVQSVDPLTFASVLLLMGAVLLTASVFPARRAARTDPATALRSE
ncbi:MAG TPA: ABC transporter permease, partial [Vicinamibacterales bacterium]|nr:ABC transporter permease [Vicinamibacterales bacterium]